MPLNGKMAIIVKHVWLFQTEYKWHASDNIMLAYQTWLPKPLHMLSHHIQWFWQPTMSKWLKLDPLWFATKNVAHRV